MVDKATHACIPMHACRIIKQETSSKTIIVEANTKERGSNDLRRGCNDSGAKCHTNLDQNDRDGTVMTGQNYQGSKIALCFR